MVEQHHEEAAHGGGRLPPTTVRQYVFMGIFLTVVTAVEFWMVEQRDFFGPLVVPSLIVLTAAKFLVVVAWFMHLRWDHPLLRRLFTFGFLLATAILFALLTLFVFDHNPAMSER